MAGCPSAADDDRDRRDFRPNPMGTKVIQLPDAPPDEPARETGRHIMFSRFVATALVVAALGLLAAPASAADDRRDDNRRTAAEERPPARMAAPAHRRHHRVIHRRAPIVERRN